MSNIEFTMGYNRLGILELYRAHDRLRRLQKGVIQFYFGPSEQEEAFSDDSYKCNPQIKF